MKYLLILMTLFFSSCGGRSYSYMADPIFTSYAKEMKERRGYLLEGTGGSMPNGDVRWLFMSFVGIREVDVPEARRLYIELVEGLIDKVNQDKFIRPFLHDFPATSKNMDILLAFVDCYGMIVDENHIAYIFLLNDKIYYNRFNHDRHRYEIVFEETYEEALRIVQSDRINRSLRISLKGVKLRDSIWHNE
jgi:hypothetical protein